MKQKIYRASLIVPVVVLGLIEGAAMLNTVIHEMEKFNYIKVLGEFIILWLWSVTPFIILLRKKYSTFHLLCVLSAYIIYTISIIMIVTSWNEDTVVARGMLILGAPLVASAVVVTALMVEQILVKIAR